MTYRQEVRVGKFLVDVSTKVLDDFISMSGFVFTDENIKVHVKRLSNKNFENGHFGRLRYKNVSETPIILRGPAFKDVYNGRGTESVGGLFSTKQKEVKSFVHDDNFELLNKFYYLLAAYDIIEEKGKNLNQEEISLKNEIGLLLTWQFSDQMVETLYEEVCDLYGKDALQKKFDMWNKKEKSDEEACENE